MANQLLESGFSRVYLLRYGAGPTTNPIYENLWRVGAPSWDQGKLTMVYAPDPAQYGKFVVAGKVQGEPGLPTLSMDAYYTTDLSEFLRMAHDQCDHDIHVHFGVCKDPRNFNVGWDKILILETARSTSFTAKELGALQPSEDIQITETAKMEGQLLYEVMPMLYAEKAGANVNDEVVGIVFCGNPQCGSCGTPNDGSNVIFAVSLSSGGSPGLLATVVASQDGGLTWVDSPITSLAANNAPTGIACVGLNTVVTSSAAAALEYANSNDILNGVATWVAVATGFVGGHGPTTIQAPGETTVFFGGVGGYFYTSADPTSGVTLLDAGTATTQDVIAMHALDINTFLAVGKSNSVVYTSDGGLVLQSVTGPLPGVDLTACFLRSATEWWVGTATGRLFYSTNSGVTWAEKAFPGSGSGKVWDIKFASNNVGYMAHATTAPKGRILRTIGGGNSWYVQPENNAVMPSNNRISALAVCPNVNVCAGGGLGSNGTDGIIVVGR
jgi:hypothetical protein